MRDNVFFHILVLSRELRNIKTRHPLAVLQIMNNACSVRNGWDRRRTVLVCQRLGVQTVHCFQFVAVDGDPFYLLQSQNLLHHVIAE